MSSMIDVEAKKQNTLTRAGNTGVSLQEWGDPRGIAMQGKIVAQEEVVEANGNKVAEAEAEAQRLTSEGKEVSNWFDAVLAGVVAMVSIERMGEVPAKTDFTRADRYVYADQLADRVESYGHNGQWLAKVIRHAKKRCLESRDKLKGATEVEQKSQSTYTTSVMRLDTLVREAQILLREELPANSPILRHIKVKRSPAKPKVDKPSDPASGSAPSTPSSPSAPSNSSTSSAPTASGSGSSTTPSAPQSSGSTSTPSAPSSSSSTSTSSAPPASSGSSTAVAPSKTTR
jgi:hypothetical protein